MSLSVIVRPAAMSSMENSCRCMLLGRLPFLFWASVWAKENKFQGGTCLSPPRAVASECTPFASCLKLLRRNKERTPACNTPDRVDENQPARRVIIYML